MKATWRCAVPIPPACDTQAPLEFASVEPLNGKRSTACGERKPNTLDVKLRWQGATAADARSGRVAPMRLAQQNGYEIVRVAPGL